jgi:DNA-binding response OmpR family regulator
VAPDPLPIPESIRFGEDLELDRPAYELRRSGGALKLERIPLDILFLLAERPGQLVTREEIAERIWGKGAHLDVDNSINGAVRKIRQVLKDDSEQPRFIQTVTGRGYRFVARGGAGAAAPGRSLALVPGPRPGNPVGPRHAGRHAVSESHG